MRNLGLWGAAVFGVFLLATLALVPASPLTAMAGFSTDPIWGTLLISPVGMLSAVMAFGIGRSVARPWVQRYLACHPRMAVVDRTVERGGFRIVFSAAPGLHYTLRATQLCVWSQPGIWSFVCCCVVARASPRHRCLYVYLGSLASDIGDILSGQAASGEGESA